MYFVIRRNRNGQFWFREVGDNNHIVAVSELYNEKASAQRTIEMIKREAAAARVIDKSDETTERDTP